IVTDGDAGGYRPGVDRGGMAEIRQREQTAAAKVVGVDEVIFLGHPDGAVLPTLALRRDISAVIRQVKPNRVLCQSPERNFDRIAASHPDHLAAGEATLCAIYPDARNGFAHPELLTRGLEPHTVSETWMMASTNANHFSDVTGTVERKLEALMCHVSQMEDPEATAGMVRAWLGVTGTQAGLAPGRLAEAFRVFSTA
ncbi:MAG: PIG-L deacetylase family protein, partial [Acidimicrobiales bacterium]